MNDSIITVLLIFIIFVGGFIALTKIVVVVNELFKKL